MAAPQTDANAAPGKPVSITDLCRENILSIIIEENPYTVTPDSSYICHYLLQGMGHFVETDIFLVQNVQHILCKPHSNTELIIHLRSSEKNQFKFAEFYYFLQTKICPNCTSHCVMECVTECVCDGVCVCICVRMCVCVCG